jgi:hypothetical protein
MPRKVVGEIDHRVVNLLGLSVQAGTEIFLGDTNIAHMQSNHPNDFEKYGHRIEEILSSPDYVAQHPKDGSAVEYIKVLDDYVLVAVRISSGGVWYARTLFAMSPEKVRKYKQNPNILKKY